MEDFFPENLPQNSSSERVIANLKKITCLAHYFFPLLSVSYLFGHLSFYEPESIDANLAEPADEVNEEKFDTIDRVISSVVAAATATRAGL